MHLFEDWFSNIVGTCEFVADGDLVRRKWIQKEQGITSIYCYDELFEQLVGDAVIREHVEVFDADLQLRGAQQAIQELVAALGVLDAKVETEQTLQAPEALLESTEWRGFQTAARRVVELPGAKKYRTPAGSQT